MFFCFFFFGVCVFKSIVFILNFLLAIFFALFCSAAKGLSNVYFTLKNNYINNNNNNGNNNVIEDESKNTTTTTTDMK